MGQFSQLVGQSPSQVFRQILDKLGQTRLGSIQGQHSTDASSTPCDRSVKNPPMGFSQQDSGPVPLLSQAPVSTTRVDKFVKPPDPESQLAPKAGNDDGDIASNGTSAVAKPSEGVVSSKPRLKDFASSVAESENDPYREPQMIPKHRPPIFVYPYSGEKIPPVFQQRFEEVVNLFMYNTRNNAQLRDSTPFIDYTLRICGQSPEDLHPSILVFCRPKDFQPLKDLLSKDRLRFQYCRRRSPATDSRKGWSTSQISVASDHNVPLFDLYFWRSRQPRELLWGTQTKAFVSQTPFSFGHKYDLSMCSSQVTHTANGYSRSTFGYVVQMGSDYYGVTASHAFRNVGDDHDVMEHQEAPKDRGQSDDLTTESILKSRHGVSTQGDLSSDGQIWYHGTEVLSDDENYLVDEGEYDSFTDEETDDSDENADNSADDEEDREYTVYFPPLSESKALGELDLDWALIKLEDPSDWRPNAIIDKESETGFIFLTDFMTEYPERETTVVIAPSNGPPVVGTLHSNPAVLGGLNGSVSSTLWIVTIHDNKRLVKGDSGSVVVHAGTNQIFGHVVASNPLGEVYGAGTTSNFGESD
ncbi:hypothetical protein LZ32DRAFT_690596 [Colletotrichum eremochloae]|nr:hypothetical protein LZ32DRAFT_690596 [Colletotrichum eremochloae]